MRLVDATVVLVANGAPDSPPASGVREHLVRAGVRRLVVVHHPLSREDRGVHEVVVHERGRLVAQRRLRLPVPPPASFALDGLVPLRLPPCDLWIGFNNLATARGLLRRRTGRAATVVHWAVDFVPNRFGATPLTRVYDRLDALCCRRAELRVEVSRAAVEGRNERLDLGVGDRVRFHGYLDDHTEVEAFVAGGAVAAATYDTRGDSFTRYADPSKLRSYTAAGLPVIVTDVPPNARELAERAGAELVPFDARAIAAAVDRVLASPEEWQRRRGAALAYAQDFDWSAIVGRTLAVAGFDA